jgi:hypothetical protein
VILVVVARVDTALKGEPDVNSQIVPNLGTALRINTRSHKADAVIDDKGTGSASHIDSYRASRVWGVLLMIRLPSATVQQPST